MLFLFQSCMSISKSCPTPVDKIKPAVFYFFKEAKHRTTRKMALCPRCLNPLLTFGTGYPLFLKSLYLLLPSWLWALSPITQLNGVMIGVGNIEISHLCPRKNVRPFIVDTHPVQSLPLQSHSLVCHFSM